MNTCTTCRYRIKKSWLHRAFRFKDLCSRQARDVDKVTDAPTSAWGRTIKPQYQEQCGWHENWVYNTCREAMRACEGDDYKVTWQFWRWFE